VLASDYVRLVVEACSFPNHHVQQDHMRNAHNRADTQGQLQEATDIKSVQPGTLTLTDEKREQMNVC